jgi:preprotein translocase subunit SecA
VSLEDDLMRMFGSERIASLMDRMGYKEGEVIQHNMISKSIERAQKKVEENNFGIRKRLLEYDDVMNKQRTVIYGKRNHALFGERLALDLDNAFYSVAEGIIFSGKEVNDHDEFKLSVIVNFGIDTTITKEELDKEDINVLANRLYYEAKDHYNKKNELMNQQTLPVIKNIRREQGNHIINVAVPFTDGKKAMQAIANLDKTIESNGSELTNALERNITLALIDDSWKEHLRAMDDLRHSVQTVGYEQKDPLVIYKIEAFGAFKQMDDQINKDIVSFLAHCAIPVEQNQASRITEERQRKTDMSKMHQRREEFVGAGGPEYLSQENEYDDPSEHIKQEPIRVGPKIGRNDLCPCGSGKKYKNCHGRGES